MAHCANSTCSFSDWKFHFRSFPYGESLFVLLVFFYGLKIQLQKRNRQRNLRLIKDFRRKMVRLLGVLLNYCARMRYLGNNHIKKPVKNVKVSLMKIKLSQKSRKSIRINIPGISPRRSYQNDKKLL